MKYITLILGTIFLLASCEENEDAIKTDSNAVMPVTPKGYSIDVNNDGIIDFNIRYSKSLSSSVETGGLTVGNLWPINETQLLYHEPDEFFFLSINDTIRKFDETNPVWFSNIAAKLISTNKTDAKWAVNSKLSSEYFLAFKLKNGASEEIGWMLFEFNLETVEITLADKEFSDSDKLIILKR